MSDYWVGFPRLMMYGYVSGAHYAIFSDMIMVTDSIDKIFALFAN